MARIFLSYRRADSRTMTERIHDRLVAHFGDQNVFKDVDDIDLGVDFRQAINEAVTSSDVVLVIIGQQWLSIADEAGKRRLDDPNDFVRHEVMSALESDDSLVIPLTVYGAAMPAAHDLPAEIRELAYRNAMVVRNDPDFHGDMDRLIAYIESVVGGKPAQQHGRRWLPAVLGLIAIALIAAALVAAQPEFLSGLINPATATPTATHTPTATRTPTATQTPAATQTPTASPTDVPTTTPTATEITPTVSVCQVTPLEGYPGINKRARPDPTSTRRGVLEAGVTQEVSGRTRSFGGYFWWRLTDGTWVSSAVVEEIGDCETVEIIS